MCMTRALICLAIVKSVLAPDMPQWRSPPKTPEPFGSGAFVGASG